MTKKHIIRNIALFIALLFHVSGLIGILFTTHKDWFIQNTPVNLLLMAALIIITHSKKDKNFYLFFIMVVVIAFSAEAFGVNTGWFFGRYTYGNILGIRLFNVPLIIGINWFIIIYCAGMVTQSYENFMLKRINAKGIILNRRMMITSFYN